jgi:aldehyde dehydrogenase (NAD+)
MTGRTSAEHAGNSIETYSNFIDGEWCEPHGGETVDVMSPSDGQVFAKIARGNAADIDQAVAAARNAFEAGDWGRLSAVERGRILMKLGELISQNAEDLAQLEARDTGKPMSQARADMVAAARYFEYYGSAADKVHGDTIPFMQGYSVTTIPEPHGVTGHVIPWNYPAQMFGRTLAPALAMGNATVLKPAEEACLTPLRITALAQEAGFPAGAINVVTGLGEEAGAALSGHDDINFLAFTGSPEVGTLIQKAAAENYIGCVLELGGKSPQIIFADADLEAALPVVLNAIVQNGGQTCSAGSRVLIEQSIFDDVVDILKDRFSGLTAGPHDADLNCGGLISAGQAKRVKGFIERAEQSGIPLLARGKIADGAPEGGYYVAPALFGPVPEDSEMGREEVFGPVLSVLPFKDEDDAVRLANDTDYGLVAGVWTSDAGRLMRVGKRVKCGQIFLNGYGAGGGIELPFGGVKKSGHGREKGFEAMLEFCATKTLVHNHG